MPINVESTSDTPEQVTAAMGDLNPKEVEKPATDKTVEKPAASEATKENKEETEVEDTEETDEESEEESKEAKDDDKPKKRSGFKRRIDKLTTKLSAKDQEIEFWKQEAIKSQSKTSTKDETIREKPANEGRPVADKFETHEAYVEALADWKVEQRLKEQETKQKQTQVKTEHEKAVGAHIDRVTAFKAQHDDFDDLIEDVDDIPMSLTVQDILINSENGPELMYELAKDRKELERICKLPALAAAREMGRFESRIKKSESSTETKETKTTKAPQPIKPVGTSKTGSGKKSIYDPDLTQREYEKLREEQLAQKRA